MEGHPDEINTVAVSLEDGTTIYAVAGEAEEKKRALKKDIQSQLREALQNARDTDDKNAIMMRFLESENMIKTIKVLTSLRKTKFLYVD